LEVLTIALEGLTLGAMNKRYSNPPYLEVFGSIEDCYGRLNTRCDEPKMFQPYLEVFGSIEDCYGRLNTSCDKPKMF